MNTHVLAQTKPAAKSVIPPVHSNLLQRKCACGGRPGPTGECEECREKRLQRKTQSSDISTQPSTLNSQLSAVPPIVHEVLRSSGQPLDPATRAFMEPRFGHDFGHVRVHTDEKAADSAHAVHAHAYTVGKDVVFGENRYAPTTHSGRELLAHELAHTIQQRGAGSEPSGHERVREGEANRAASQALSGRTVAALTRSGVAVARQPSDEKPSTEWIDGQILLVNQQLQMPLLPPPMKAMLLLRLRELEMQRARSVPGVRAAPAPTNPRLPRRCVLSGNRTRLQQQSTRSLPRSRWPRRNCGQP